MRRWKEEITTEKIEQYFQDVDVVKLTDNRYNCISMYRKILYLANYDVETGKTKRGEKIGYVVSLSTEQNYARRKLPRRRRYNFRRIHVEVGLYPDGEVNKLMNYYATVDRKRLTTRVWLVGNTISRVCPYINEWGLHKIISNQKQGTIETLEIKGGYIDEKKGYDIIKIAVEYCESTR